MANQKQKEKKKKQREKIAHQRVLKRREQLRKERKLQSQQEAVWELEYEAKHGKRMPIVNDPLVAAMQEDTRRKKAQAQLERNLKILEALEAEMLQEQANRAEVNKSLEAEGHLSIKEKMDALHKMALEKQGLAKPLQEAQEQYLAEHQEEEIVVDSTENE